MAPPPARTAHFGDKAVLLQPRETLLLAAERAGVALPSSCRVGGCGTCRCRVTEGRVREGTESAYLLSGEEIAQGFVLACQSVPLTDVRIELPSATTGGTGRVVSQELLSPELARLCVQLDAPLPYAAGQSCALSVEGLDGVERSYSFACASRPEGLVRFLVRRAPGGRLSNHLCDAPLVGRAVRLGAPAGSFRLSQDDAPLLFVAGGSGLAPILALLEEAFAARDARSVTLLFGARDARELAALDALEPLAAAWPAPFRIVPVLSAPDAGWSGARGLVTDPLDGVLTPGARVHVCGPPAMVDRVEAQLEAAGVPKEHVRCDRFTPRPAPLPPLGPQPEAHVGDYGKFFLFHGVGGLAAAALLAGGAELTAGLLSILALYMLGDALCGDDLTTPRYARPFVLTAQLWLALPLLSALVFLGIWHVSPGDPLGFGAAFTHGTGWDVLTARDATAPGHHVSAFVLLGLMIGLVGTITAHELTHRTWDPISMLVGRWLLAFSFDTSFAIEHVYGHHRYVSTVEDPATAPRGRNVYWHILASTVRGNVSAFRIERARLRRRGRSVLSPHNAFLRGHAMSLGLVVAAYTLGGWAGALFFVASALWGKALLEIVNYMEHYGIVRSPETPVQPRHSWNTNRRISSWSMFNLTRHSHHHAQGEVPYHELRPFPASPLMINGYLTTIVVAMLPPLWHRLMTPKLVAWDRDFATDEERALAARANARSGLRALRDRPSAAS